MRSQIIICLFVTLLFQAIAMASHGYDRDFNGDSPHAVLHQAGVSHHHQADGSLYLDSSDKSKEHIGADHCPNTPGLLPTVCTATMPPVKFGTPPLISTLALASPFIEGPRRPPRLTA
ncbi:MAG: hypothetical protein ABI790_03220, partial [Betaproteobacteria bacterium]